MFENRVKILLGRGDAALGAALPDASNLVAKLSIDTGVDFLWIDTEHGPFGIEAITMVPVLCRMKSCVPVIRVAGLDPNLIKKALDIGASGVMVPQVNNAEEARLAVQYAKYPPAGTRGVSPTWTIYLDVPYSEYLPAANDETCVIVQVESAEGLKNLESIAEVEGVDVVFAGPSDLAASLGHIGQIQHRDVQACLEEFPRRVARTGKASGISVSGLEPSRNAYAQGYRFINIGHILVQGMLGLTADLRRLRELVGDRADASAPHATVDG
jgi:4-hydroxy-2-oxoheptanedioate aldolase